MTRIFFLSQADPYLSGEVRPIQDRFNYESSDEITSKISNLKESIKNLNSLEIKLKVQQTYLKLSLIYLETTQCIIRSLPLEACSKKIELECSRIAL